MGRFVPNAATGRARAVAAQCPAVDSPLRTRLVGTTDADDVTQDVLVAIAGNVVWLLEPGLFRPGRSRIASRAAFSHLRRVRRRGVEDNADTVLASLPAPEPPPDNELLAELLDGDVLLGSQSCRAGAALSGGDGVGGGRGGPGDPLGTVKSRLAYGLKTLRRYLEEKRS